ncbi:MAG: hypothetical protein HOQ06_03970 [Pseudarthrobacter sp.]|nr:hypothetical protein [Pseudarthrobacter sp.]
MTQENQQAPETAPGGYGTPTAEQEAAGTQGGGASSGGTSPGGAETNEPQAGVGQEHVPHDMDVPSSAAEIDEANDDSKGSAPVSSESGQEAAGVPDGSGNELPQEKSPNDEDESFDAG